LDLICAQQLYRDPKAAQQDEIPSQYLLAAGRCRQEEIADTPETRINSQLLLKMLEEGKALQGEADMDFGGELIADPTQAAASGTGSQALPLQEDDLAHSPLAQMISNTGPDDASPNDHYSGALFHLPCNLRVIVIREACVRRNPQERGKEKGEEDGREQIPQG
jgi:hypothetical protein